MYFYIVIKNLIIKKQDIFWKKNHSSWPIFTVIVVNPVP